MTLFKTGAPLQGDKLLFNISFPEASGANLGRIKG